MQRFITLLFAAVFISLSSTILAINEKQIHEEARFIADKIAYQFGLDKNQLADAYEINYDFLKDVYPLQDALIAGDDKAITQYYIFLDRRNSELVWIMDNTRYGNFVEVESLFRPLYIKDGKLQLRLYDDYRRGKFFEGKPKRFGKYKGENNRDRHKGNSVYQGKYKQIAYGGQPRLLHDRNKAKLSWARKADFGK